MKNALKQIILPVFLIAGGIVFIILGVSNLNQVKNFPEVQATVTNVEQDFVGANETDNNNVTVYVHYIWEGKDYDEVLQYGKADYNVGDTITVRVDPEKPTYVSGASKTQALVYIAFGALLALAGLAAFFKFFIRR